MMYKIWNAIFWRIFDPYTVHHQSLRIQLSDKRGPILPIDIFSRSELCVTARCNNWWPEENLYGRFYGSLVLCWCISYWQHLKVKHFILNDDKLLNINRTVQKMCNSYLPISLNSDWRLWFLIFYATKLNLLWFLYMAHFHLMSNMVKKISLSSFMQIGNRNKLTYI